MQGYSKYFPFILIVIIYMQILALKNLTERTQKLVDNQFQNASLLVIAHPDDETMFFGPTILSLVNKRKELKILCLSSGDARGLGHSRMHELKQVVSALGDVVELELVNDESLPDNIDQDWDVDLIVRQITSQVHNVRRPIKQVISFDDYGISDHPNHKSINKALKLISERAEHSDIDFLVLESVPIWRKYISFLDAIFTILASYYPSSKSVITLSLDFDQRKALQDILTLHQSQMVWFRQLYMTFSRYMFINDLRQLTSN